MKQPALGIVATAIAIVISLGIIGLMSPDFFMNWASYFIMCALPFTIVVGAFWKGEEPKPIATLGQPLRGIAFLIIAAIVAAIVGLIHMYARGGGQAPPPPIAVMTIITSVVTAFFMAIVFGGWPFSLIKNKVVAGFALLIGIYVVNALVFQLMNFGFASGAPFYRPELDPGGPFGAWDLVTVMVSALAILFVFLNLDLWPLNKLKGLGQGPLFGLVWALVCFALGWVLFAAGTAITGMPAPTFLVTVPIPLLFGLIITLQMLGGSILGSAKQPVKGLVNVLIAAVVGGLLAFIYSKLMPVLSAAFPSGPEGDFAAQVWLANALLAMTFPIFAFFGDYFQLWPLAGKPAPAEVSAEKTPAS